MMLETRAKNKLWLAGAVVLIPDPMALNAVPAATIVVLSHRFGFRPKQLPGGERQLVAIARALANDPPLILADEPTANLGSAIGRQVARLLRRLATQDRRAVVIVSHDSRLEEIADRVLWLRTAPSASWRPWPPTRSAAWPSLARPPPLQGDDTLWWFCSAACRDEFAADLGRFAPSQGPARREVRDEADRLRRHEHRRGRPRAVRYTLGG